MHAYKDIEAKGIIIYDSLIETCNVEVFLASNNRFCIFFRASFISLIMDFPNLIRLEGGSRSKPTVSKSRKWTENKGSGANMHEGNVSKKGGTTRWLFVVNAM